MIEQMKQDYGDTKMCMEMIGEVANLVTIVWLLIRWNVNRLICEIVGHEMVDTSVAGPDTGCASGDCKRCGYSFYVTLY